MELFLQSSRPDPSSGDKIDGAQLDAPAVERAVLYLEKMLSSQEALSMGGSLSATFVCLAMALEERPGLHLGALRCYEKALEHHSSEPQKSSARWERSLVLQQLGAVCMRNHSFREAGRWLTACADEVQHARGNPRDVVLFNGAFKTQQSRHEFEASIEKLLANACLGQGDKEGSRKHLEKAQAIESSAQTFRAVDLVAAESVSLPDDVSDTIKSLWQAVHVEEKCLKEYQFVDEGSIVRLTLDLNEHLGMGQEASAAVTSLQQFRVMCTSDSVDVSLRLRRTNHDICQFRLLLCPLAHEIVPDDTVPRLRGRDNKRRLEVMLFKQNKDQRWCGDLVSSSPNHTASDTEAGKLPASQQPQPPAKGTLLNPLSQEELARLPVPSGGACDNRPSCWSTAKKVDDFAGKPQQQVHEASKHATPQVRKEPSNIIDGAEPPAWVAHVEQREEKHALILTLSILVDSENQISTADFELDADPSSGEIRLDYLRGSGRAMHASKFTWRVPPTVDATRLCAKWSRKSKSFELRFPWL